MGQINPQIAALLGALQQPQAAQPPLSEDPTALSRGQTAMHTSGGRGRMLTDLIKEHSAKGSQSGKMEPLQHARSDPQQGGGSDNTFAGFQNRGPLNFLDQRGTHQVGVNQAGVQLDPYAQQASPPTAAPQGGAPEERLDRYEAMLSQTDPAKAADLALKRQEMLTKQAQAEHKADIDRFNANAKAFPIGGKGTSEGDAQSQQTAEDATKAKASAEGMGPTYSESKDTKETENSEGLPLDMNRGYTPPPPQEEGLPTTPPPTESQPPKKIGMLNPSSNLMERLHLHKNAETITPRTQYAAGKLYKSPSGRIHRMIGAAHDGSPLFSPAIA